MLIAIALLVRVRLVLSFTTAPKVLRTLAVLRCSHNPLDDASSIVGAISVPQLTVVIPAYNEELRILETLETCQRYLSDSDLWKQRSTILVVDDGSTDTTVDVVRRIGSAISDRSVAIHCVSLETNQGKGAALARGIREACEKFPDSLILTTDADGSPEIAGLEDLYASLETILKDAADDGTVHWDQAAMINGYRTYQSASASRLIFRWGFRTVVKTLCGDLGVQDSQCGFKLMTAAAASRLYSNLHVPGWSHDVEVLFRARHYGVQVAEHAVGWEDKAGSKLVASPCGVIAVSLKMFLEVLLIRWSYATGRWKFQVGAELK